MELCQNNQIWTFTRTTEVGISSEQSNFGCSHKAEGELARADEVRVRDEGEGGEEEDGYAAGDHGGVGQKLLFLVAILALCTGAGKSARTRSHSPASLPRLR